MREIKFRAWSKQHKEMLDVREIGFKQNGGIEFVILIKPRQINERGDIGFEFPKKYIDGNSLKLMQYTGLKDKNGEEIYEGDIIKSKISFEGKGIPHMGEVVYDKELASFATKNLSGNTLICRQQLNTFEVIGNKYEDPELLGDTNECS